MKNKMVVTNIELQGGNKLIFHYQISGEWKKFFGEEEFFVEYDQEIKDVPDSIKIIPFLCNVLPIAWISQAEIQVQSIDLHFEQCTKELIAMYQKMYPNLSMDFNLIAKQKEENINHEPAKRAMLFSGGVDSFSTLMEHIEEKPELITVWGADVLLTDKIGWENVTKHIEQVGKQYDLGINQVKTNFRSFIHQQELNEAVKQSRR